MGGIRVPKRPRDHIDDGGVHGLIRPGDKARGKRPRTSPSEASDEHVRSGTESERTANDSASDDDQDTVNDDANLERATQVVTRQLRDNEEKQNLPAEQGIIEEIRCTNFMCHEQLTVPLGPLINFIIGHNGSGKSAVLTALTLCLGGKATATNRGQNLKSFIKEGRDSCSLSVKIKNQGSAAFKPDTYGRSIIVERHFNKNGSSGFKIKDVNGKVVTTKKAELEDILDAFALQIDNPMNVLTQDMARQFLNDSSPKEKYKFFLKGTQLEALSNDYAVISNNLDVMESKTLVFNQDIEVLRKQAEAAVAKARRAANLQTMRDREKVLASQAAWARVQEEEEELSKIDDEITHVTGLIKERTAQADSASDQYERANKAFSDANQSIQDQQAELVPVEQEVAELKSKWDDIKKGILKVKTTEREISQKLASKERSIESYEAQIVEHRHRQAEADDGQHAQKMHELEEAKEAYEEAKTRFSNHDDSLPDLTHRLKLAEVEEQKAHNGLLQKQGEIRRSQEKIGEIERGQQSWTDAYPNSAGLSRLVQAIQGERRFRERPVGPIGRYVKLLKPEWSSILERQAGASLNAFVVINKDDQTLLSDIMKRLKCQYPIYIGSNQQIDTAGHEPDSGLDTWMRVLKIDHNLIRNQMIINHSIDQAVLIKDRKKAEDFMQFGGPRRQNVKMCFCMRDGDPTKGHFISFNPQTEARTMGPINEWKFSTRMQADREPQLKAEKSNLDRLRQELRAMQSNITEIQYKVKSRRCDIQNHDKEKRQLKIQFQTAQESVERLESELSAATPNAGMIEQLEEALRDVQNEKDFEEGQYQDTIIEKDKLNAEARGSKSSLEEAQDRLSSLNIALGKAASKADKMARKREEVLREKNRALEEVHAAERNKTEWEQKRGAQLGIVEENTQYAMLISSARVEVPRGETHDSLMKKLDRLVTEREESEKQLGGSEEELLRKANEAKQRHKAKRDDRAEHDRVAHMLKKSLINRKQRWERFRQEISLRARITFTYLLSERQFRGTLQVDHKSQQLDIHVQPDITVVSGAGRQTKTLSGGEKSFSTICLLLALWDAMGSPIRCLDEFDVFMDNVNREISMKMMIGAARRAVGRQFILITPQAMGKVESKDDVKIIRMDDPERGQTALSFSRRGATTTTA
ncbi:dna repair protein-like protein rad18 [Lojkania enalia]|uniref:Dna repair protein-like protein rad18 n=1 Tax=Lojkania enalia TaxID=147567 RepID=A0A9P4KFI0_9PLEO|nr:dna repair protein-like protein rad18 [Didymosphaeria enalia]